MDKSQHENIVRPVIKTVDRDDEDTFSFAALAVQDKPTDEQALDQGTAANTDSPADFLFANGQLLPHAFPVLSDSSRKSISKESLTSSSSKGSSTTSRSSSTSMNSRQNSNSNGSDSERVVASPTSGPVIKHVRFRSFDAAAAKHSKGQLVTGVPSGRKSTAEVSRRKKVNAMEQKDRRKRQMTKNQASGNSSAGRGIFQSFMSACRECHALEPSMQVESQKMAYGTWSQTSM
ncbi:uncharacterized protein LOC131232996 [Magnolia sinica]|uniref:uncharacterized protein LOC131232996 n=1 Tax=Magnolia sinica TaxID=86752 RepID=UPI002658B740|nr:uncharacterized protein LOC131232996 [Magnolia sinica]